MITLKQTGLFVFSIFLVICKRTDSVRIFSIQPLYGSINGETKISIFGKDFDTNLNLGDSIPNKEVSFANSLVEYPCKVHDDESDENQTVCYTVAMPHGDYYVRMKMNGKKLEMSEYCYNHAYSSNCRLRVRWHHTPLISTLSESAGEPHEVINVNGRIFTNLISSADVKATNGRDVTITRAWLKGGQCKLYNTSTTLPYGIKLSGTDGTSNWGYLKCYISSSYIGNQNVSIIVSGYFGRSLPLASSKFVSADGRIYMLQTYAVITDVSPKKGSIAGGTLLTISGRNFDERSGIKPKVLVGGEECKITSVTSTEIKCLTPPQVKTRSMYSGGRGMKVDVFPGVTNIEADLDSFKENVKTLYTDDAYEINSALPGNNFATRTRGYFLPSVTANYRFSAVGDDRINFYFNSNGWNSSEATLAASTSSHNKAVQTPTYYLKSGTEYYFETKHVEWYGHASLKLGVHVDKTTYTPDQTNWAVTETQTLSIANAVKKEIQTVTLQNWNLQTPAQSVWTVNVHCLNKTIDCTRYSFKFLLYRVQTVAIPYASSASTVASAINNMIVLEGDSARVTSTSSGYKITFASKRGRMKLSAFSFDEKILSVNLTETVVGSPRLDTMTFMVNGYASFPIPYDASPAEVAKAVNRLFGSNCPNEIESGLGSKRKVYYNFEDENKPSGSISSEVSFCGVFSLKNPYQIFLNKEQSYKLSQYPQVCFAYIGDIADRLSVSYTFTKTANGLSETVYKNLQSLGNVGLGDSLNEWKHFCYDLNSRLRNDNPDGRTFFVSEIVVGAGSNAEEDLYLDNVFIGLTQLTEVERIAAVTKITPSSVPHIRLNSVEVSQTGSQYRITFNPADCGYEFPLLGFAFASSHKHNSTDVSEYFFGSNEAKIVVKRVETASSPVSGTFDINFADSKYRNLSTIPANVTASVLENYLESLMQIDDATVERTGTCYGYSWKIKFKLPGGNYPTIIPNGNALESSPNTVEIITTVNNEGGLFMNPIHGDFIRTAHDIPQIQVDINNIPTHCLAEFDGNANTSCGFEWHTSMTPQVTDVTPSEASAGTQIQIRGSGFSSMKSNNKVLIGGVRCIVLESSWNKTICELGNSPSGKQLFSLTVGNKGLAVVHPNFTTFQVVGSITSFTPSKGSAYGCTDIVIEGSGFDSYSSVMIGNSSCVIKNSTYNKITCKTTAGTEGLATVHVKTANVTINSATKFHYTSVGVANIASISPAILSVQGGQNISISGSGFGSSVGQIYFGNMAVENVLSWSDNKITLAAPALSPDVYNVTVNVKNVGCARSSSVNYDFSITDISPSSGSLMGGTMVTITGSGFTDNVQFHFGKVNCGDVTVNANGTVATCVMNSFSQTRVVTNGGRNPSYGIGYWWDPSTLDIIAGDSVTFSWSFPDHVNGRKIGLFTTANPSSVEYNDQGFQVKAANSGRYTFVFNNVGTHYYSSGCIDWHCNLVMKGTINVGSAKSQSVTLSATIGGIEGIYKPESKSYTFDTDATAVVSRISPTIGTVETTLKIEGNGFAATPSVTVGGKLCKVENWNSTHIYCKIPPSEELSIDIYHPVMVNIAGKGKARIEIRTVFQRNFVLLPSVSSVNPNNGSMAGGTKLKIQGSGFNRQASVKIGLISCYVIANETTYNMITCVTSKVSTPLSGKIEVTAGKSVAKCFTSCNFEFTEKATPLVTSWSHNNVWSDLNLTFVGEGFANHVDDVTVTLTLVSGDISKECKVTFLSNITIRCRIGKISVGLHDVSVYIKRKGLSRFIGVTSRIRSPALIDKVEPNYGSINGGTTINITGNGFVAGNVEVDVGGVRCDVTQTSLSSLSCITGARMAGFTSVKVTSNGVVYPTAYYNYSTSATPVVSSVSPTEEISGNLIMLNGSGFGNSASNAFVSVGGAICSVTAINDSTIKCVLGVREGGAAAIKVHVSNSGYATIAATFSYLLSVNSLSPTKGSYGGGQNITVIGQGFSSKTVVEVCGSVCKVTLHSPTAIRCLTPPHHNRTEGNTSCLVTVSNGNNIATFRSRYTYQSVLTPSITSVSPSRGGTGGGTVIYIAGTGFKSFGEPVDVSIDGSVCDISHVNDTLIICQTNQHSGSTQTKVTVATGNVGIALQERADFYYIDRWSSKFTWGGKSLPTDQDFVVIQKGQTVLLDTNTPVLKMLLIDGGKLIFDEKDVTLSSENILITNGGLLQVGTEEKPFESKANIIMYGNLRSPELPIYGAKTLGVRNGTLDLHGRHIPHPWTKLNSTAQAGTSQITLEKSVNWLVGDSIVIATTGLRHSQAENEKRIITNISPDGHILILNEPLEYEHLGVIANVHGVNVDFRAEVGLLSRNIVFRGSKNHVWEDKIPACEEGFDTGMFATQTCFQGRFGEEVGSDEFGASIMLHSKYPSSPDIMARIENVEVTYAGQAYRLGRYPIHFHLMGNVSGMYVRRCAIHKTFNRAITIHGTFNLLVDSNVVFDIFGGAIFIEDGIETNNVIQYNLAVFVRQSQSLLNDDVTPAAYWVTNPNNVIRHNHAAGGTHFGFWYRMHKHPDGPSFTTAVCQQNEELGQFENNTVHSQGWFGLWIFQSYFPMKGGGCSSTIPSPARFRSLTTWNCEKGAEWVNCGAIQFIDFLMVNNEVTGIDLKLISKTAWGDAMIQNAIIIGHTEQLPSSYQTKVGITLPFSSRLFINKTRFINFDRGGVAFSGTTVQGVCVKLCGGYYFWTQGLVFTSVLRRVNWRWKHEGVILDIDGSLTNRSPMSSVAPYTGIFNQTACPVYKGIEFSGSGSVASSVCIPGVRFIRLALKSPIPTSLEGNDLYVSNQFGNTSSTYEKKRLTLKPGWMMLLQAKEHYKMWFKDGEQITNITYQSEYYELNEEDYLFVSHRLKQRPDAIKINGVSRYSIANAPILTPQSDNLNWHYSQSKMALEIIVSGKSSSRKRRELGIFTENYKNIAVRPQIYRCFYLNCTAPIDKNNIPPSRETPSDARLWSEVNNPCMEWIGNHTVVIKRSTSAIKLCWVVVDVASIRVDNITVDGVLQFKENTFVSAIYIMVKGGRIIAGFSKEEFFTNQLTIELRGNHNTKGWALPGVELGAKALGCFGGCDFHGIPRDVYWTHLAQTAPAGADTIVLQQSVDWKIGDEIVITTTGYRSIETEKHTIKSVSEDLKTIKLTNPLVYRHLGASYTAGEWQYEMRAEVGLLSRNIKIKGESYPEMIKQAFGARVLVGYTFSENNHIKGWGRFTDVEFHQTGQEGWTDPHDPRFSLVWLDTGVPTIATPSHISGCSFHDGFSTAIGTFGADDIKISDNIVHQTIHDGIRITGSGHELQRNLVTVTLFRGTYHDRLELTNFKDWQASFELSQANQLTLIGNVAAGSERIGFHIDGEACNAPDANAWKNNVAHGCLHGVQLFIMDGVGKCSIIRNFVIYKSWDYGLYHQTQVNVIVKNTKIIDSTVAYMPIIFGPPALSHQYEDKAAVLDKVLCVGRSNDFDPLLDFMDEQNDKNLRVRRAGPNRKPPLTPTGGNTCVMLPSFLSSPNGAPFKPFHAMMNYPAIRGLLSITDLHAHLYKSNNGTRDLVFFTNPANEDAFHPTYLWNVTLSEVELASKIFYLRPSISKINPSDCVDMECDGKNNVLVKDFTGGFLATPGSVIPEAEFGWDDPTQKTRGIGDYRIPKTLLTNSNGGRIPVDNIIDGRGIVRNSACTKIPSWQAYDCHGPGVLDYRMLVIESLDSDTETRRLSPVALLGERYIQLNNGPQDHGWCFGYTCQLRLSTFYTIIATGIHYDIFFTGSTPNRLRLHLLNVDNSQTVRVAIWYSKPQRLDVYQAKSDLYIHPKNSFYNKERDFWDLLPVTPENENEYKPSIKSPISGANFFDRMRGLLYITIRGSEPIDIVTSPAVIIEFGFPATTVDDFFEKNLISNLAKILGVPSSKIRIVEVVRETGTRKRRDTSKDQTVTFTIMFSDSISNTTASTPEPEKVAQSLNNASENLLLQFQKGDLWQLLNVSAGTFASSLASAGVTNTTNATTDTSVGLIVRHSIPTKLKLSLLPTFALSNSPFYPHPVVTVMDAEGKLVSTLGGDWMVRASLVAERNTATGAELLGDTTIMMTGGTGTFSNLRVTKTGRYRLHFQIIQPAGISLSARDVYITINEASMECSYQPKIWLYGSELQNSQISPKNQELIYISPSPVLDVTLLPKMCVANLSNPQFHVNLTACGAIATADQNYVYVTYVFRSASSQNHSSITTETSNNRTCRFNIVELLDSPNTDLQIRKNVAAALAQQGVFRIDVSFYEDETYKSKMNIPLTSKVNSYIYVKAEISYIDSDKIQYVMQINKCWATPNSAASGSISYNIFEDRCDRNSRSRTDGTAVITRNFKSLYGTFKFLSFEWTNAPSISSQSVYVHCLVTVCDSTTSNTCTSSNCNNRQRRAMKTAEVGKQTLITSGPITVLQSGTGSREISHGIVIVIQLLISILLTCV